MKNHYFDFESLKEDFIEEINKLNSNDMRASDLIVSMSKTLLNNNNFEITLHYKEVKELVERYKSLEEDLETEYEEEIPSASYITDLKKEMTEILAHLLELGKFKSQDDNNREAQATPEDWVTYWLTYSI